MSVHSFRCCEMCLCEIFFPQETVFECLAELGELGIAQFIDLNASLKSFQRKYVGYVRSCSDMERRLRFLEKEMRREGIKPVKVKVSPPVPKPEELEAMMSSLQKLEEELVSVNNTIRDMQSKTLHYIHLSYVLDKTAPLLVPDWTKQRRTTLMFSKTTQTSDELLIRWNLEHLEEQPLPSILREKADHQTYYIDEKGLKVQICAGVVMKQRVPAFRQMLWRVSRGNIFMTFMDINDPLLRSECVFLITFQGEALQVKVRKICEGFRGIIYPCPTEDIDRMQLMAEVGTYIHDADAVLQKSIKHRGLLLVAGSRKLEYWYYSLWKVKGIYHTMNMFDNAFNSKCLVARAWIPEFQVKTLEDTLERVASHHNAVKAIVIKIDTHLKPPAYNNVNKYTKAFQIIVDAYGVNSYGEVNPAPFTIITFPFLFSVMFGDAGHGFLMTLAASFMVIMEKKLKDKNFGEIMAIMFAGRYMVLLMGLFSMYSGFMYNDCFGIPLSIISPSWRADIKGKNITSTPSVTLDPECDLIRTHPFGVDVTWRLSQNEISFTNSLKMKMSITFGILHMLFGLFLGLWNHIHLKKHINIIGLFVPQVLLLVSIFFYMVILIFYKWAVYGPHHPTKKIHCAPSILNTIIGMMLMSAPKNIEGCENHMYPHQNVVQPLLLVLAALCIPWMLLAKPLYFIIKGTGKKENASVPSRSISHSSTLIVTMPSLVTQPSWAQEEEEISDHEEDEIGEICINQAIHTIEFVLGTVSHTASYLRLWALSLAHSQLTLVLLNMVLDQGLRSNVYLPVDIVMLTLIFAGWAGLTFAILVIMEGLSAFLHTLRLHWVEFQSKFYEGLGYAFVPFMFKTIILESKYKGNQNA